MEKKVIVIKIGDTPKPYKGGRIQRYFPNVVEMTKNLKEGQCIMYDLESGYPYVASIEERDAYKKLWDATMGKALKESGLPVGKIIITGTGSDSYIKGSAEDMFYNPEKYNGRTDN